MILLVTKPFFFITTYIFLNFRLTLKKAAVTNSLSVSDCCHDPMINCFIEISGFAGRCVSRDCVEMVSFVWRYCVKACFSGTVNGPKG